MSRRYDDLLGNAASFDRHVRSLCEIDHSAAGSIRELNRLVEGDEWKRAMEVATAASREFDACRAYERQLAELARPAIDASADLSAMANFDRHIRSLCEIDHSAAGSIRELNRLAGGDEWRRAAQQVDAQQYAFISALEQTRNELLRARTDACGNLPGNSQLATAAVEALDVFRAHESQLAELARPTIQSAIDLSTIANLAGERLASSQIAHAEIEHALSTNLLAGNALANALGDNLAQRLPAWVTTRTTGETIADALGAGSYNALDAAVAEQTVSALAGYRDLMDVAGMTDSIAWHQLWQSERDVREWLSGHHAVYDSYEHEADSGDDIAAQQSDIHADQCPSDAAVTEDIPPAVSDIPQREIRCNTDVSERIWALTLKARQLKSLEMLIGEASPVSDDPLCDIAIDLLRVLKVYPEHAVRFVVLWNAAWDARHLLHAPRGTTRDRNEVLSNDDLLMLENAFDELEAFLDKIKEQR